MLEIRRMSPADLAVGLRLKTQAGWNQLEADWRRALELFPDGCFVAEWHGKPVGTTTCCRFDTIPPLDKGGNGGVAWIAMVLVEEAMRGQGIGKALMRHALTFLDERGVRGVWLDATALGQPLYEKLGFVKVGTFLRYARSGLPPAAPPVKRATANDVVQPGNAQLLPDMLDLDRSVYRYDRSRLLLRLHAEQPAAWRVCLGGGRLVGFSFSRPGANASHIGPCVADEHAGQALLLDALERFSGQPVFVDVPETHAAARALLEASGLQVQRTLVRMVRGEVTSVDLARVWAGSGPEKG